MTTCREEAQRWVHRYALGGAAFAAIPVPISTTAALAGIEAHLAGVIAGIYGDPGTGLGALAAGGAFNIMGLGLKHLAVQASLLVPGFGIPLRMAIAGATIETLGHAIIAFYEKAHPGKMFTPHPAAS